jgi:hypothetical protein
VPSGRGTTSLGGERKAGSNEERAWVGLPTAHTVDGVSGWFGSVVKRTNDWCLDKTWLLPSRLVDSSRFTARRRLKNKAKVECPEAMEALEATSQGVCDARDFC